MTEDDLGKGIKNIEDVLRRLDKRAQDVRSINSSQRTDTPGETTLKGPLTRNIRCPKCGEDIVMGAESQCQNCDETEAERPIATTKPSKPVVVPPAVPENQNILPLPEANPATKAVIKPRLFNAKMVAILCLCLAVPATAYKVYKATNKGNPKPVAIPKASQGSMDENATTTGNMYHLGNDSPDSADSKPEIVDEELTATHAPIATAKRGQGAIDGIQKGSDQKNDLDNGFAYKSKTFGGLFVACSAKIHNSYDFSKCALFENSGKPLTRAEYVHSPGYERLYSTGWFFLRNTKDVGIFFNDTGKEVLRLESDMWPSEGYKDYLIAYTKKKGVLDRSGKIIVPFLYDELNICDTGNCFAASTFVENVGFETVLLDHTGEKITSKNYSEINTDDLNGRVIVTNVSWISNRNVSISGIVDANTGAEIVPLKYSGIIFCHAKHEYCRSIAPIAIAMADVAGPTTGNLMREHLKGLIDFNTGKELTPLKYQNIRFRLKETDTGMRNTGMIEAEYNGEKGIIDVRTMEFIGEKGLDANYLADLHLHDINKSNTARAVANLARSIPMTGRPARGEGHSNDQIFDNSKVLITCNFGNRRRTTAQAAGMHYTRGDFNETGDYIISNPAAKNAPYDKWEYNEVKNVQAQKLCEFTMQDIDIVSSNAAKGIATPLYSATLIK